MRVRMFFLMVYGGHAMPSIDLVEENCCKIPTVRHTSTPSPSSLSSPSSQNWWVSLLSNSISPSRIEASYGELRRQFPQFYSSYPESGLLEENLDIFILYTLQFWLPQFYLPPFQASYVELQRLQLYSPRLPSRWVCDGSWRGANWAMFTLAL